MSRRSIRIATYTKVSTFSIHNSVQWIVLKPWSTFKFCQEWIVKMLILERWEKNKIPPLLSQSGWNGCIHERCNFNKVVILVLSSSSFDSTTLLDKNVCYYVPHYISFSLFFSPFILFFSKDSGLIVLTVLSAREPGLKWFGNLEIVIKWWTAWTENMKGKNFDWILDLDE